MRLALKLSLAMMGAMVIALVVDGVVQITREVSLYEADAHQDLEFQSRAVAAALHRFGGEAANDVVASMNAASGAHSSAVLHLVRRGLLQIPTGAPVSLPELAESLEGTTETRLSLTDLNLLLEGGSVTRTVGPLDGNRRVYTYLPLRVGLVPAVLELSKEAPRLDRFIRERLGRAAGTVAVLAALTWLIAMGLGARLVGNPISGLIEKAHRAGRGDFSRPLVVRGGDELAQLSSAVNEMCDQLDAAQKRLERETSARLAAMNQLRRADRLTTVGRLAAGLAHEVGTPLNVISEHVKMLAADELRPEERPPTFRVILEQLDRITVTIRQLLDFSRQHEPEKLPCTLVDLARQTAELITPIAEKQLVTLEVRDPGEPVVGDVDPRQIQQVLTNLMVNGVQASPHGGRLEVSFGRSRTRPNAEASLRDYLTVTVTDSGEGIPKRVLPHIFEPFFTTKGVGEGTGLGLSVSLGIVEEHGGFIGVESEEGRGSRFTVHLPVGGES
jgi:two-component system NtrC family sensor kinase